MLNALCQQRVSPTVNTFSNVIKLNSNDIRASNPNFDYDGALSSPMAVGKVKKQRSQSTLSAKESSSERVVQSSPSNLKAEQQK